MTYPDSTLAVYTSVITYVHDSVMITMWELLVFLPLFVAPGKSKLIFVTNSIVSFFHSLYRNYIYYMKYLKNFDPQFYVRCIVI